MAESFGAALKRYIASGYTAPDAMRAVWHDVKVGRVERPRVTPLRDGRPRGNPRARHRKAVRPTTVQARRAAMKATARGINPIRPSPRRDVPVCLGHVQGSTWRQEWYETASRDARVRARMLRAIGYRITTSPYRGSVTPLGTLNLTLLDVREGTTEDRFLERVPPVRCEHMRRNPLTRLETARVLRGAHSAARLASTTPLGPQFAGPRGFWRGKAEAAYQIADMYGAPSPTSRYRTYRVGDVMRRTTRGRLHRNPVAGFEAFDLEDRAGWERAIRTAGGLRVSRAERGEYAELPGYLKGYKRGVAPDELAQMIAAERGLSGRAVERAMLRAFHGPRRRARALEAVDLERLEREAIQAESRGRRRGPESRPRVGVGADTFTLRPRSPFRGQVHFVQNRRGNPVTYGGHVQALRHVVKRRGGTVRWLKDGTIRVSIKGPSGVYAVTLHTDQDVVEAAHRLRSTLNPGLAGSLWKGVKAGYHQYRAGRLEAKAAVHRGKAVLNRRRRGRAQYCSERLEDPRRFDRRSFRTVVQRGHRVTVGCPTGKYDARRRRCTVGTRAQRILHPAGEGRCPLGGRELGKENPRGRVAWYVGVFPSGRLQIFEAAYRPTRAAYPHLTRALGPFRSATLARQTARRLGAWFKKNPPRGLTEIYRRILEIKAVKGPRRVSHFPRERFRHPFTRGGRVLGVGRRGRYALKRGDLVVRGKHPLWAPVEV